MIVALGSRRTPKVEALKGALDHIRTLESRIERPEPEIWTEEVETTAPDMPLCSADSLRGARERAEKLHEQLLAQGRRADFCVGLEGGIECLADQKGHRLAVLESWAYVFDGVRGSFGRGGGIVLPQGLAGLVLDDGLELGPAADRYFGLRDVRSRQGTWGVLTGDLIPRRRTFEVALIAAWAPFYNPRAYD